MSEGIPNQESNESVPSKQEVIDSLRTNKEDIALLVRWIEGRQVETREDDTPAVTQFNLELAEVYEESGLTDMAIEAYADLETFARNTGNVVIETLAQTKIAELGK